MIYASSNTDDLITFTSTEGSSTERPYLTLTWEDGAVATPTVGGVNTAPTQSQLVWDTTSHALIADRMPTFSWSYSGTTAATDWRLFIQEDASDDMAGLYVYDSRVNTTSFDVTNLTFTPDSDLTFAQEIRWMVQPINNGMLGPRSNATTFYLPNDLGEELNSTHATLMIQEGAFVPSLSYPSVTADTYLDSGNIYANQGSSSSLYVGRSQVSTSNPSLRASSLIDIDFSSLPMPGTYEVVNASLEMTAVNSNNEVFMTVSEMITAWSESSSWAYPAGNTSSWQGVGAYHSTDSEIPETEGVWVNTTGTVALNVTSIVQHALAAGQTGINVIVQPEEIAGVVAGRVQFASSEASNIDTRPRLNLTYRLVTPWAVPGPTGLVPADGATLWDTSQPRPSGQDTTTYSWNSTITNQTQLVGCFSYDPRFVSNEDICTTTTEISDGSISDVVYDALNRTVTESNMSKGDFWTYWRIRADQGDRIGEWSSVHKFRNPSDQGSDDGNGNHTVNISRGSVFDLTGTLPLVPDVEIASGSVTNKGSATTMVLGTSSGGSGESRILLEFDLSAMPWPAAMTPTQMMLRMYQTSVVGTSSTTFGVYPCGGFSESTVVWTSAPTCSSTEITRSTLTLSTPIGWMDWDLTSLAQDNIANGNTTMTVMIQQIGTTGSSHSFFSSENGNSSFDPHLVLDYVDNTNGIVPPAQPSLTFPNDGEVLYDESNGILSPETQPMLSWTPLAAADGYIVTIANQTGVYKYKSWEDSEITHTTLRFETNLTAGSRCTRRVHGVNQSTPGPSSSRCRFALGSPTHVSHYD